MITVFLLTVLLLFNSMFQVLLNGHFDSRHLLEHKLSVVRTLSYRADNIPSIMESKET